jgi:CheY-like chemotaxis protein
MTDLNHILYVDDEPDMRMLAQVALESLAGWRVTLCETGAGAADAARAAKPQLILLDVMMPGMDGPSTLKALKNDPELGAIPIAFMTAKASPEDVREYRRMGAIGVVRKPFDPASLHEQIRELWEYCQ